MIGLLALTGFHGLTMMPFWPQWMAQLGRLIGDSGQLLTSFTIGLLACMAVVAGLYSLSIVVTRWLTRTALDFKRCFATLAFATLPLAFTYHLAHNLNHLVRESGGWLQVVGNPLGLNALPLSMAEKHLRHQQIWLSAEWLHTLQAGLMVAGFWMAMNIIRQRGQTLTVTEQSLTPLQLLPIIGFTLAMTGFHLWMLMQPMLMRM